MVFMKRSSALTLLTIVMTSFLVSSCGVMYTKMVIAPELESEYNLLGSTESEINAFYKKIETVKGQIVEDDKGQYYHKQEDQDVYSRFCLLHQDTMLKKAISGSIGLMEPVYSYQKNTKLALDWPETKRMYSFLVNTLGIKLLPLKNTQRYHDQIEKAKDNKVKSVGFHNVGEVTASIFAGEAGLYNPQFYENVLAEVAGNASYLVSFKNVSQYYGQMDSSGPLGTMAYESNTSFLMRLDSHAIDFTPIEYFKSLKKGGAYRLTSGCSVLAKKGDVALIRLSRESSDIPYYSGIAAAIKDKNAEAKSIARQKYYNELKNVEKNRLMSQQACVAGFNAMELSSSIESSRLE
jgi:hypothetical protein